MTNDEVSLEPHPADDDLDTGVFRGITDAFIAETDSQPSSIPPVADFTESEAYKGLEAARNEARQRLKNIMFLTAPPKMDE